MPKTEAIVTIQNVVATGTEPENLFKRCYKKFSKRRISSKTVPRVSIKAKETENGYINF